MQMTNLLTENEKGFESPGDEHIQERHRIRNGIKPEKDKSHGRQKLNSIGVQHRRQCTSKWIPHKRTVEIKRS